MRSILRSRAITAIALCSIAVTAAGCGSDGPANGSETVGFPDVTAFDYQLGGAYTPQDDVELVVRDRTAEPEDGVYSVCYVNAFQTQPGDLDAWSSDLLLTRDGEPVADPDWPDEVLLDTSTADKRDAIAEVLGSWIRGCADDGFDAVEFDNLDSFSRSGDALTIDDNLALAEKLAGIAHEAGLAAGQKNSAEHTDRLRNDAGFDFAVAEECAAYDECTAYTDAYGDAVIDIEYTDTLPRSFAEVCADADSPAAMILRDRDLVTPDDEDYVLERCPS
ncbi:hypothetical protein GCM10010922_05470 [Microbacterium sorbitolivorans]|uniref:endo alpha-1,4 polygalactosaminidase n=1 Tax=Microbacterium sorbitolivorans TaxID=1867410 RepID=UPI0019C04F6B|nr:endo alpha-1,4 polygalactosaminidase [Microbacterium sorbitolivorans]GGF33256.1 hypothetical protein GCM10010922_05470 [Microbacterium sorbitolivorans]